MARYFSELWLSHGQSSTVADASGLWETLQSSDSDSESESRKITYRPALKYTCQFPTFSMGATRAHAPSPTAYQRHLTDNKSLKETHILYNGLMQEIFRTDHWIDNLLIATLKVEAWAWVRLSESVVQFALLSCFDISSKLEHGYSYSDKVRLKEANQKPWRWSVSTACAADSLLFHTYRIHASDRILEATVIVSQIIAIYTRRLDIFNSTQLGVLVKQFALWNDWHPPPSLMTNTVTSSATSSSDIWFRWAGGFFFSDEFQYFFAACGKSYDENSMRCQCSDKPSLVHRSRHPEI